MFANPKTRLMSGSHASLAILACIVCLGYRVRAEEGLFRPEQIHLPVPVHDAIPSVVRVVAKIAFDVQIFRDHAALKADAALHPEREKKIFLKDGVRWAVNMAFDDAPSLCVGPTRGQPGNAEICVIWLKLSRLPVQIVKLPTHLCFNYGPI